MADLTETTLASAIRDNDGGPIYWCPWTKQQAEAVRGVWERAFRRYLDDLGAEP